MDAAELNSYETYQSCEHTTSVRAVAAWEGDQGIPRTEDAGEVRASENDEMSSHDCLFACTGSLAVTARSDR